jgi:DNA polymerase
MADYKELLNIFNSGQDAYAQFGAQMFGIPGLSKESHPELRQSAKSALLGAGYGLGWVKFAATLLTGFLGAPPVRYDVAFAKQLGVTGRDVRMFMADEELMAKAFAIPHICTQDELVVHCIAAKNIIDTYRSTAQPVKDLWALYDDMMKNCLAGERTFKHKFLTFSKEKILLPSGMYLKYPNLHGIPDEKGRVQWEYAEGPKAKKLYGSKIVENVVQAIARIIMTDGMLRIQQRYPCVMTVHDEAVMCVPETEVEEAEAWVLEQMTKEPKFMPGLPLAATVGAGKRYGECK